MFVRRVDVRQRKEGNHGYMDVDEYKFEPVMEDGKPVVRPLTAEDIDAIGPACMAKIMGF